MHCRLGQRDVVAKQTAELLVRDVAYEAAIGHEAIVNQDQGAIGGEAQVGLDAIDAQIGRRLERGQRVFRHMLVITAMAEDEHDRSKLRNRKRFATVIGMRNACGFAASSHPPILPLPQIGAGKSRRQNTIAATTYPASPSPTSTPRYSSAKRQPSSG